MLLWTLQILHPCMPTFVLCNIRSSMSASGLEHRRHWIDTLLLGLIICAASAAGSQLFLSWLYLSTCSQGHLTPSRYETVCMSERVSLTRCDLMQVRKRFDALKQENYASDPHDHIADGTPILSPKD